MPCEIAGGIAHISIGAPEWLRLVEPIELLQGVSRALQPHWLLVVPPRGSPFAEAVLGQPDAPPRRCDGLVV
ncbi:MAG: hypothetical protein JWP31_1265, partial [Aeromicrobium sp.]|nr:hypothetical protein [Aeromicrobium sp.]